MTRKIYKYVLLNGCDDVVAVDSAFRLGVCEVRLDLPFDAQLLSIGVDPNDPRAYGDIVTWYTVDPAACSRPEPHAFYLTYTGQDWPERRHLATLYVGTRPNARVVHVFGGGVA